jgi:flagellar biosynthesis/type III secretory pathway chaperone
MKASSIEEIQKVLEKDQELLEEIYELEKELRKISLEDDKGYEINEKLANKWKELLDHRNKNLLRKIKDNDCTSL